ncbi:ORC1-type DNA replication protein [Candidatus Woesearchaeota archaeon]|nr:ORC1-type DNA replication protein [Candidatus Woesearchaeota archaeon]
MRGDSLTKFFNNYLEKPSIFLNKKVLQSNYTPDMIPHRNEQIDYIAGILAPCLRLEKPSNLFLYGKTGTGKTVVSKYVTSQILKVAKQKNLSIEIIYLNCKLKKVADTEYRLIVQLAKEFGIEIPPTGLPTDEVYKIFIKHLEQRERLVILILDEIDQLVKKTGDEILYNLTRINSELNKVELSIIGISNDLLFMDNVDPRVKSSLSEEELVFAPYNALQIQDILRERSKLAFRTDVIQEGVIEKCAAYAAREHGDARRALELLRVAAELSERRGDSKILIKDIDDAEEKIEKDKVLDIVHTQPKQFQLTLLAILDLCDKAVSPLFTGDVYEIYKDFCSVVKLKPLTQRRVSDIIAELDMLGIINAKVISKGRYGRTKEIRMAIPQSTVPTIRHTLKEGLNL